MTPTQTPPPLPSLPAPTPAPRPIHTAPLASHRHGHPLPPLPPSLEARVRGAVARNPPRSRRARRLSLAGWTALALVSMVAALYGFGGPDHALGRPDSVAHWVVAGVAAVAALATWWSLPHRSMLPPPAWKLVVIAVAVPALVGAWLIGWHSQYQDPFWRFGTLCFELTLLSAIGPYLLLFKLGPRFAPASPRLAGAALGAVSGAWSAIVVELWCPLALPRHVLVGHVLPLVALVLGGALLGGHLLRPRATRRGTAASV